MGYVLPVRHFEYENYHQRVTGHKTSTFTIESPLPIVFHRNPEEFPLKQMKGERTYMTKYMTKKVNVNEEKIAKITGKGIHFNESI